MTKFTKALTTSLLVSTAFVFSAQASFTVKVEETSAPKNVFVSSNSFFKLDTKEGRVEFPQLILRTVGSDTMTSDTTDYTKKGATVTLEEDRVKSQLARFFDVVNTGDQEDIYSDRKLSLDADNADLVHMIAYVEALKAAYKKAHANAKLLAGTEYYVEAINPVREEFEGKLVTREYKAFEKAATVANAAKYKAAIAPLTDTLVSKPLAGISKTDVNASFDLTEKTARDLLDKRTDNLDLLVTSIELSLKLNTLLTSDSSAKYGVQYLQASFDAEAAAKIKAIAEEKAEAKAASDALAAAQLEENDGKGKEEEK